MTRFVVTRLALALVTLLVLSVIVFAAAQVLPGDPGRAILGPEAASRAVATLDRQLGVDRPVTSQYWHWLSNVVRGDLGTSYAYHTGVAPMVLSALVNSLKLAAVALVMVVPLALIGGVVAALKAGQPWDRAITLFGMTLTVVPEFVSGVVLIIVFGVALPVLPTTATPPAGAGPATVVEHLILPAIPLCFALFGYLARITRANTIEALDSKYTRTARLKGMPQPVVVRRHVLRNSLMPTITVLASQTVYLVGGLVVVETLFRYQGIGTLMLTAANGKDFPVLEGSILTLGAVLMAATLAADIAYAFLDPRIRWSEPE